MNLRKQIEMNLAREKHLHFMKYLFQKTLNGDSSFVPGFHIEKVSEALDTAVEDFKEGKDVFLLVNVPYRHGKTELIKHFIVHMMAMFKGIPILYTTHSQQMARKVSDEIKAMFSLPEMKELYPNVRINPKKKAKDDWEIEHLDSTGQASLTGANSSFMIASVEAKTAGMAGSVLLLDDVFPNAKRADSPTSREAAWEWFQSDFMTRSTKFCTKVVEGKPVAGSITIAYGTLWHPEDPFQKIRDEMAEDPTFPRFKELVFPAKAKDYEGAGEYPGEYLFEKVYTYKDGKKVITDGLHNAEWYTRAYALLSDAKASALLDCHPVSASGNILNVDAVNWYQRPGKGKLPPNFPTTGYMRVWDLAHSDGIKSPKSDYTGGTLLCIQYEGVNEYTKQPKYGIYILDYSEFRMTATKRDKEIEKIALRDGQTCNVVIEHSNDSIDTIHRLKDDFKKKGLAKVDYVKVKGNKQFRAEGMEHFFENGNIHCLEGDWRRTWEKSLKFFDGTERTHDEAVDNLTAAWAHYQKKYRGKITRMTNVPFFG